MLLSLNQTYAITKPKTTSTRAVDRLHDELRCVAVQNAAHAVGTVLLDELIANDAVPAGAVLAVGEDADRKHAPQAVDAVHGDRADRIVHAALVEEEHALDDDHAGDRADHDRGPRIDERARRRDRDQAREHAVAPSSTGRASCPRAIR